MSTDTPQHYFICTIIFGLVAFIGILIPKICNIVFVFTFPLYLLLEIIMSNVYPRYVAKASSDAEFLDLSYWDIRLRIVHNALILIPIIYALMHNIFFSNLTVILFLILFLPYLLGQIIALIISAYTSRRILIHAAYHHKCSITWANLHIILHFIPFADIYSAFTVYRKLTNTEGSS